MRKQKSTKATLNRKIARVRQRAERCGRAGEFEAFRQSADIFLDKPARHNARGISAGAIADVRSGYERFGEALLIAWQGEDHAVRHQAEKTLRAIARGHVDFETASERLKKVRGANRQAGKRRQEKRRADGETEKRLSDHFSVKRVRSVQTLQAVGRSLKNCCSNAGTAREYLQRSEMWVLLDRGQPLWLLAVDTDRNISECEGKGGVLAKPAKLERQIVRRLLEVLNASADEEPTFLRDGYHSALLHAYDSDSDIEDVESVFINRREYVVHRSGDQVLVGRRKPGKRWRWSSFCWAANGSLEDAVHWFRQPISEATLLGLVIRCPELGVKLR